MSQITVILPVLNGMPFLRETLASLEAQTYRDFEVVLWDNGSTDGTVEEAQHWIPSRLPGRVVTGESLPLHSCLARMVEEAKSPLIARMDADDVCLPHRFAEQMSFLEQNPDVALVGCQIESIDPQGAKIVQQRWARFPTAHEDIVTRLLWSCPFCHPSILFRREPILSSGNYAVPAPVEDLDLYLRLVQEKRVANLPTVGLHYRYHPQSICSVATREDRLERAVGEAIANHAKELFGMEAATYLQLRAKAHPLAIKPLFKSALHRADGRLFPAIQLMRSPMFIYVGRCLTAPRDFISKLAYKLLEALG